MLSNNLQLKIVQTNEFNELQNMASLIWNEHYVSIIGQNQVDYMLANMYSLEAMQKQYVNGQAFYFIFNGSDKIGFVGLTNEVGYNYINKWYIALNFRGKGLGLLMFKLIQNVFNNNLPIKLNVNRQNYTAINFYFKCGFVIDKIEDIAIGDTYFMNDFVMIYKS